MSVDFEFFCDAIAELEGHFNKQLTAFIKDSWFSYLQEMTEEQLIDAVRCAVCECNFMPSAADLLKFGNGARFPGENAMEASKVNYALLALTSSEENAMNFTPEQISQNITRLRQLTESLAANKDMRKLRNRDAASHSLKEGYIKPHVTFEAMRKLMLSDDSENRKIAIAWAKRQNDVILIFAKDGDVEACDINLIEAKREGKRKQVKLEF